MRRHVCVFILSMLLASAYAQGLKLFSSEMKKAAPKPQAVVMDFMERYFYELRTQNQTTVQTKMADDKVYFRKGSLSDLSQVVDTMPLNISLVDRHYEVRQPAHSAHALPLFLCRSTLEDTVLGTPDYGAPL